MARDRSRRAGGRASPRGADRGDDAGGGGGLKTPSFRGSRSESPKGRAEGVETHERKRLRYETKQVCAYPELPVLMVSGPPLSGDRNDEWCVSEDGAKPPPP